MIRCTSNATYCGSRVMTWVWMNKERTSLGQSDALGRGQESRQWTRAYGRLAFARAFGGGGGEGGGEHVSVCGGGGREGSIHV